MGNPASIILNNALKNYDLGEWLKSQTGGTYLQGIDFKNILLKYTTQAGISVTPGGSWDFYSAIGQLPAMGKTPKEITAYDTLAQMLRTYFVLPSGLSKGKKNANAIVNAAWQSLSDAKFNLSTAKNPIVSVTQKNQKATLVLLHDAQKALANQTAAGISSATAGQQANAIDNIQNTIEAWNYTPQQKEYLSGILRKLVTVNGDHIVNQNALTNIFRGVTPSGLGASTDAKIKADYNSAFPGLAEYNKQKTAIHMNESQYMAYTQKIQDVATQYGAPMPNQSQIAKLINGHVSAVEYQQRVTDIYAAVSNADDNVKKILQQQFGIGPSQLMHYFMDPKNALQDMQRNVASAEIQDYSQRVGLSGLDQSNFTQLANMAKLSATQGNQVLGYGVSNIQNALLSASKDNALTASLPGTGAPTVDTKTLVGSQLAGFAGTTQTTAQTEVARAEQAKVAPFEKGGGYQDNAKGVVGLGSART